RRPVKYVAGGEGDTVVRAAKPINCFRLIPLAQSLDFEIGNVSVGLADRDELVDQNGLEHIVAQRFIAYPAEVLVESSCPDRKDVLFLRAETDGTVRLSSGHNRKLSRG